MNIAERTIEYYGSDDFKSNYIDCLREGFWNERDVNVENIYHLFNFGNCNVQEFLNNFREISYAEARKIHEFIHENIEEFTRDFRGYYVGSTSLDSIAFGEQEEQIEKKDINAFERAGYYVSDDRRSQYAYAYWDLSDTGLHVDLLGDIALLDSFLLTLENNVQAT
jgi:hypothetical protein